MKRSLANVMSAEPLWNTEKWILFELRFQIEFLDAKSPHAKHKTANANLYILTSSLLLNWILTELQSADHLLIFSKHFVRIDD